MWVLLFCVLMHALMLVQYNDKPINLMWLILCPLQAEAPWKQRVFPLTAEDEDALFSDDPQKGPPGKFGSVASLKHNLSSACAALPSGGQSSSSSRRASENSREGSASVWFMQVR